MSTAYTRVHGKKACSCIVATIKPLERDLVKAGVIKKDLSGLITQGSYNGTVAASGSTHDGGGVWDVAHFLVDTDAKKEIWFRNGWLPMDRRPVDAPRSKWKAHGHVKVAGCPHADRSAKAQEAAIRRGRNGLANNGKFRGTLFPIVTWDEVVAREAGLAVDAIVAGQASLWASKIPRVYTPKGQWPLVPVAGAQSAAVMDRLRMQLSLKPTGKAAWTHYDVAALKVWLNQPYVGVGVLDTLDVYALQSRVKVRQTGKLDAPTWTALAQYLNKHR